MNNDKLVWVDATKELPPAGEYVLVHLVKDNWHDPADPDGVYYVVARLEQGLSMADRARMKAGELADPDVKCWSAPGDVPTITMSKRSAIFKAADEGSNNMRPYQWVGFGAGGYFGQEVDFWMRIPRLRTVPGTF